MLLCGLMASGECATGHRGACRSFPGFVDCAVSVSVSDVCGLLTGHCALLLREPFSPFSLVGAVEVVVKNGKRMFRGLNGRELVVVLSRSDHSSYSFRYRIVINGI